MSTLEMRRRPATLTQIRLRLGRRRALTDALHYLAGDTVPCELGDAVEPTDAAMFAYAVLLEHGLWDPERMRDLRKDEDWPP